MSRIFSNDIQPGFTPDAKRQQKGRYPEMEDALKALVFRTQGKVAISDFMLYTKANQLLEEAGQDSKVSLSWVTRFKTRHDIKLYRQHGEAGSVDTTALHQHRMDLQVLLVQYAPRDVLNLDETGLFYRMQPSQTLATAPIPGKKKDKSRILVGLCCNMDGSEKLDPIVINRYQNPRCFKGVNVSKLRIRYYANKKTWMTSAVFVEGLKALNLSICGRNVLLFVDNASSHMDVELSNVHLHFLPPNTTFFLQPMDGGIIKNFKLKYKTLFVQWTLDKIEAGAYNQKVDVLSSIQMIVEAWKGVSADTIRNCWAHTGIVSGVTIASLRQQNQPRKTFGLSQLDALIENPVAQRPDGYADDYLACDDSLEEEDSALESDAITCPESDDASSDDEDPENRPLTHREALNASKQLATYIFANNIESRDVCEITEKCRQLLIGSMRQQQITAFFTPK